MKYVSEKVKHEETLIKLTILVMASAYTPNPLNLALEVRKVKVNLILWLKYQKYSQLMMFGISVDLCQVLTREWGHHVD